MIAVWSAEGGTVGFFWQELGRGDRSMVSRRWHGRIFLAGAGTRWSQYGRQKVAR